MALVSALEAALKRKTLKVRAMKAWSRTATVALVLDDGSEVPVDAKIDKKSDVRPERLQPVGDAGPYAAVNGIPYGAPSPVVRTTTYRLITVASVRILQDRNGEWRGAADSVCCADERRGVSRQRG